MKMEQTECSETPAYKIQTPGNYPEKKHTIFLNFFLTYNTSDIAHRLDQGPQNPIIGGPKGQFLKLRRAASNFSEISSWKCCL
jgi:hypothetical protein